MTDFFVLPALIYIIGAFLVPLLKGKIKSIYILALPVIGFINLLFLPEGLHWTTQFLDLQLIFLKVDQLSLLFGYLYCIMSLIQFIYVLNIRDDTQYVAAFIYSGSALGVIFAGDWFSFYIFWELMAVSSVFLIWARRTEDSRQASYRYLLVHITGGLLLLGGIIMYAIQQGSIGIGHIELGSLYSWLIFLGMGINGAWPILHAWLPDAYPRATVGGPVFMNVYTTHTAIYALARVFPGTELLIWIGVSMTVFVIFYAVIENDLRRVLSYSEVNQIGYMTVSIGVGTELAINGAVSYAFVHSIFKTLLFMSTGAVLYRTGTIKATNLGGLYKSMPLTTIFCIVGAASIAGFPLFSGFVTKEMIISSVALKGMPIAWLLLLFASVGVLEHAGIKIPYFAFFSHDSGIRVKEAPKNMLVAMGLAAFLCVFIGVYPQPLYNMLPYAVNFVPYTAAHVVNIAQLLLFGTLAFILLLLSGIYPPEIRAINLDTDWFYRKGGGLVYAFFDRSLNELSSWSDQVARGIVSKMSAFFRDAVAKLAVFVLVDIGKLFGMSREELESRRTAVYHNVMRGAGPIGIGAAIALIFIVLILVFR